MNYGNVVAASAVVSIIYGLLVVLTANLVASALGTIFSLIAQLGGVPGANALGWSTVVLYLLFALAFAYLRFMKM